MIPTPSNDHCVCCEVIGENPDCPLHPHCPECGGQGFTGKSVARCCGGSDWECGARGCTGPTEEWQQELCEYCGGSGLVALSGEVLPEFDA